MASLTTMKSFAFKAAKAGTTMPSQRYLSSQGLVAVEKLRSAMEEYRKEQMCLPSRFKKDILAAAHQDEAGKIPLGGMQRVISNISMEHKISPQEMETIFSEEGEGGKISVDRMMKLL